MRRNSQRQDDEWCSSETEQPQEPDPKTSHEEEEKDRDTWPLRGERESEINYPHASQIIHLSKRAKGRELEGSGPRVG